MQGQKQEHPGVGGVSEQGASTGQEASEQSSAQGGGAVGRETVEGVLGAHGATQGGAEHVGGHEKGQVEGSRKEQESKPQEASSLQPEQHKEESGSKVVKEKLHGKDQPEKEGFIEKVKQALAGEH